MSHTRTMWRTRRIVDEFNGLISCCLCDCCSYFVFVFRVLCHAVGRTTDDVHGSVLATFQRLLKTRGGKKTNVEYAVYRVSGRRRCAPCTKRTCIPYKQLRRYYSRTTSSSAVQQSRRSFSPPSPRLAPLRASTTRPGVHSRVILGGRDRTDGQRHYRFLLLFFFTFFFLLNKKCAFVNAGNQNATRLVADNTAVPRRTVVVI